MTEDAKKPLGRILLKQRAVTQPELDKALATAEPGGPPLASRLMESGAISELAALKALSEQSGVPGIDLSQVCLKLSDLSILPREVAVRHKLLPVLVRDDRVFVAMAAPTERKVIDELEFVTGKRVFAYIALAGSLMRVISAAYEARDRGEAYYVGPNCPPEVQRRAGLNPDAAAAEPEPPPLRLNPDAASRAPVPTPGAGMSRVVAQQITAPGPVVVADKGAPVRSDELNEADFGLVDRDLSVMTGMPKAPQPKDAREAGKRTVLVVDDEEDIRKLLRKILEEKGYRVLEADRGLVALHVLKEQPPDVVILDAMLPEVHGFDIAKRMRGSARYGNIPIIMVSAVYRGWRFAEDLKASYGVHAYIEKPFRVPDVLRAVESAIERTSRGDDERISAEAEKMLTAGIEAYQKGDMATAVERLREGTRIDPFAYRLHYHLGLLYGKQGQIYDAIQELQTALEINGSHFPALKNLAVLYQKAGFRNKAIETWERALRHAPDEATRQSIKEHLVGLL